jgi:hypothetical protein
MMLMGIEMTNSSFCASTARHNPARGRSWIAAAVVKPPNGTKLTSAKSAVRMKPWSVSLPTFSIGWPVCVAMISFIGSFSRTNLLGQDLAVDGLALGTAVGVVQVDPRVG